MILLHFSFAFTDLQCEDQSQDYFFIIVVTEWSINEGVTKQEVPVL